MHAGHVLLELGMNSKNKEFFRQSIKNSFCKNLVPKVSLEIRDLDTWTKAREVHEATKRDMRGGGATGKMKTLLQDLMEEITGWPQVRWTTWC